jgi:zinc protease
VLREDAGGVYGVGVNGGIAREPVTDYSISINFGCAPENVDKLVALVMEEIRKTKQDGIEQNTIDKVIAEQTRGLENSIKENSYWRYMLEQQFFRNNDPLKILNAPQRIKLLTVDKTKTLANKFFDDQNVVKLVLLPEKK